MAKLNNKSWKKSSFYGEKSLVVLSLNLRMCAKIGKSANTSRNKKKKNLDGFQEKKGRKWTVAKKVGKRNFVWLKKL